MYDFKTKILLFLVGISAIAIPVALYLFFPPKKATIPQEPIAPPKREIQIPEEESQPQTPLVPPVQFPIATPSPTP